MKKNEYLAIYTNVYLQIEKALKNKNRSAKEDETIAFNLGYLEALEIAQHKIDCKLAAYHSGYISMSTKKDELITSWNINGTFEVEQ